MKPENENIENGVEVEKKASDYEAPRVESIVTSEQVERECFLAQMSVPFA